MECENSGGRKNPEKETMAGKGNKGEFVVDSNCPRHTRESAVLGPR